MLVSTEHEKPVLFGIIYAERDKYILQILLALFPTRAI